MLLVHLLDSSYTYMVVHLLDEYGRCVFSSQELARRFNLSFGLDQVRNREAVAAVHK